MAANEERAAAKRREIVQRMVERFTDVSELVGPPVAIEKFAERVVDSCCEFRPPDVPESVLDYIALSVSGRQGGRTRKLGNIAISMRRLVGAVASGALVVVGMTATPWAAPLGALVLWDTVWSKMELDIEEREASVLWAMWTGCNQEDVISKEGLICLVNRVRHNAGRLPLSERELEDALTVLKKMRCIAEDGGCWRLREAIAVEFE